jgi:hypothetical protein
MYLRKVFGLSFLLFVTAVYAQNVPVSLSTQERITTSKADTGEMLSKNNEERFPDKPQPLAREGQWIADGEQTWQIPDEFVMVAKKSDGRYMWHVEKVNSCAWCGDPMTWKQAMFDKKASSMFALRTALFVADIEITHHLPCFQAGTCKEVNPLLGQTRLQGYSVAAGLTAITWVTDGWARKGNRKYRIGGFRPWWVIPVIGDAVSSVSIITNLTKWHRR